MSSFSEPGHPSDESADEVRRKEREIAAAEANAARRQRMANWLRVAQVGCAAAEAKTGDPAYRALGMTLQLAIDRLQNSE
ncbi:hypothetical protein [Streptomyces sp. NPDC017988]|uniref:hypothetical protein n=1 Tax=Streptomyces sp. NPDC017988 TaxID=3365025 RepID=UPI003794F75D